MIVDFELKYGQIIVDFGWDSKTIGVERVDCWWVTLADEDVRLCWPLYAVWAFWRGKGSFAWGFEVILRDIWSWFLVDVAKFCKII